MKKSFIAYSDWKETFDELPNEEAGKLIKHIFAYVNNENPVTDSILIKAVFANIKSTLIRDMEKWETQLQQRKEAGKKSAELRATKGNERSTSVDESTRNSTDNVSVSVNVNDSVSDNVNKKKVGLSFVSDDFVEVVERWLDYKRGRKEKYKTEDSLKTMYNKLLKLSNNNPETAQLIIEEAISNNYAGFFALKNKPSTSEYKKPMYWHFKFRNNLGTYYYPDPVPEEQGEAFKQQQFARADKPQLIEEYLKPQSWRN